MSMTTSTSGKHQAVRARYIKDTVETIPPSRLVTMLYDALVTNLDLAERGILAHDLHAANRGLVKAQAILIELRSSLKPELWSGGPRLAALYEYLIREVVQANVAKDARAVKSCRELIEPLRDAWHVAAREVAAQA
jgi:flagellar secretion chaperone FliS